VTKIIDANAHDIVTDVANTVTQNTLADIADGICSNTLADGPTPSLTTPLPAEVPTVSANGMCEQHHPSHRHHPADAIAHDTSASVPNAFHRSQQQPNDTPRTPTTKPGGLNSMHARAARVRHPFSAGRPPLLQPSLADWASQPRHHNSAAHKGF
jgi:hypothetical protein